jgi:hypothetical protein
MEWRADAAWPEAAYARPTRADVALQALDGSADRDRHLAEGGQRCAATASSTGGMAEYPFSAAPSTRESDAEAWD